MELFKLLGTIAVDNSEAKKSMEETTSGAKTMGNALDEAGESGEKSGGKLSGALSKIGGAAVKVGKVVAAGIGVAATGVAALTKSAVDSYADYEQLVGGVDTLFKNNARDVLMYANKAYETAGLSANEYMETVTSFSASLLQSLDGDTKAAADKANQAIIDMSDNANKMGTDMSMIQNAYQGFAKQNYTMLDNLKLGYGGTKEEMARLLADASAISGIKYDISSYADVVDAIHVIQTEMGITGTTAKEASSTISGSIGMMKSSWQNLITAMADKDADLSVYVERLVDSVATVANNLMPVISTALGGVVQLVNQLAPVIIGKIPELFNQLLPTILDAAVGLINSIVTAFPGIISALVNILPALIDGIVQIVNSLVEALPGIIEAIVSALPSLIPALINGLVSMIVTLCEQLPLIIQPIIDYLPDIIISLVDALVTNLPVLIEGVISLVMGIVEALPQIITSLVDALPTIIDMIVTALQENLPALIMGCVQVVKGLVQALPQIWSSLAQALPVIFKGIWDAVAAVFAPAAEWLDTNVIQPVANFFQGLWETVKQVWDGICNAVKFAFNLIASIISAAFQIITLPFRFIWENCKEYVFAAFEWIKEKISTAVNWIRDKVKIGFNWVKEHIVQPITAAKNKVVEVFNNIKSAIQEKITAAKEKVVSIFNNIKSAITTKVNDIKSSVTKTFESVKEKMSKPIEKARDTIKGIVDKIKGFFSGLKLKFPNIKMPHFKIKPSGWKIGDLLEGSIPKLSIDWYARAMSNPVIMTKPTVFGYNAGTGELLGGGEAGSEVVSGTGTLMGMISAAVAGQNAALADYMQRVIEILASYFPQLLEALNMDVVLQDGVLVGRLAPAMNEELAKISTRKDRGR